jgi:hypothetical protein
MSTSLCSTPTPPSSGAALAGAGDREAPHTHSVTTTQREREAMLHHADEQSPPPSLLAASRRPCRPLLSRARRKLSGASHRFRSVTEPADLYSLFAVFWRTIFCQWAETGCLFCPRKFHWHTDDMTSTRDWKAIPPALDIN